MNHALSPLIFLILRLGLVALVIVFLERPALAESRKSEHQSRTSLSIEPDFAVATGRKVDLLVRDNYFDRQKLEKVWKPAFARAREKLENCRDLATLHDILNGCLAGLETSHCEFATINDEIFHFLHSLFGSFEKPDAKEKIGRGPVAFVGFVTGGPKRKRDVIRYVLDGSPASKTGLSPGDRIISVDGLPYKGYSDFLGRQQEKLRIVIERRGERRELTLTPEKKDLYEAYVEAMRKSVRIIERNGRKLGYIHVWCGGMKSHDALIDLLQDKLLATDGLIFDLRDGYGGNSLDDLDWFYRTRKAYPVFKTTDRNGKTSTEQELYDRPMVALINEGSRSGKELLAFSLKSTGRARLVGTTTAGAVVAGRLFPINSKCSLYLSILDITVAGERIEGKGVEPDCLLELDDDSRKESTDNQIEKALEILDKI
ncbi:MAG: PDZ domain-containing protein [Cyanobacteria bacterium HKST-UBA02]|nr:PDZ domain-containing protein [Cyanobacteria bacterium HKST-UBA02]